MTPTKHPLLFPFRESLGSFPTPWLIPNRAPAGLLRKLRAQMVDLPSQSAQMWIEAWTGWHWAAWRLAYALPCWTIGSSRRAASRLLLVPVVPLAMRG